jgi:hypothetical protein
MNDGALAKTPAKNVNAADPRLKSRAYIQAAMLSKQEENGAILNEEVKTAKHKINSV